jgi:hypothetical protein
MAKKTQIQKFREAAREAGTDDSEERFDATLKELAKIRRKQPGDDAQAAHKRPSAAAKPKH